MGLLKSMTPLRRSCSPVSAPVSILLLAGLFFLIWFSPVVNAKMGGMCNECHTMHNSENGSPVATDLEGNPVQTPYPSLLISSCLGCHTSPGNSTIVDMGSWEIPAVNNLIEPVNSLAGGNFYYVEEEDSRGHNISQANPDGLLSAPPGGAFPEGGDYEGQLRCAGTHGCHGYNGGHGEAAKDDEAKALGKAHHGAIVNSPVAESYRYLYGIKGKEDPDWERDNSNTSHNEYKGSTNPASVDTMSSFCSECHGNFHGTSGAGTSSPWIRHPTDKVLPVQPAEYAGYTVYSMVAPLARPDPDNVAFTNAVTPGQDIIMCLSCHRAHGSPYYKSLRWNYKSSDLATSLSGCSVCHTGKQ